LICSLFCLVGWKIASDSSASITSLGDYYFIAFSGPVNESLSMIELLLWFIPHMLFFYLIGDMAYGELSQKGYFLLPILGSRGCWWSGKVLTLFILSVLFVFLQILALTLGAALVIPIRIDSLRQLITLASLWPNSQAFSGIQILLVILVLYITTLFALGTLQMTFSFFFKRSVYSFLFASGIALISSFASINHPELVRWLPGAQSMLIRHTFIDATVPGFSLLWSISYNVFLAAASVAIGLLVLKRLDITRSLTRE
jgi:hypothetical protein